MQNKPNFEDIQMSANIINTKTYEDIRPEYVMKKQTQFKANTNPIKAKTKPISNVTLQK
ncbi:MAG: hypothetical protein RQ760_18810 [Sedimentisphaerales bacterium]|nr:hypothetical protein [Sedimentisphaerales bacterium]